MKKKHELSLSDINTRVSKINQKHIMNNATINKVSVTSVLHEAEHFKYVLTRRNIKSKTGSVLNVLDFYKLLNHCNALEAGLKISGKMAEKTRRINNMNKKNHKSIVKLPTLIIKKNHMYKRLRALPTDIMNESHIMDGKHMPTYIYNMIGHQKLNYRVRKQLNKVNVRDRLYILKIKPHKRGIIKIASEKDIMNVINALLSFLKSLK